MTDMLSFDPVAHRKYVALIKNMEINAISTSYNKVILLFGSNFDNIFTII